MKPNNAGKNIWLRAQTLKQKLKQNAQTHDVDVRQVFFLCYIRHSQRPYVNIISFIRRLQAPIPLCFRSGFSLAMFRTSKRKLFDISRRSHPVMCFQYFHTLLAINRCQTQFILNEKKKLQKLPDCAGLWHSSTNSHHIFMQVMPSPCRYALTYHFSFLYSTRNFSIACQQLSGTAHLSRQLRHYCSNLEHSKQVTVGGAYKCTGFPHTV